MGTPEQPPGTEQFEIRVEAANSHRRAVVTARGEIDLMSAPDFRSVLDEAGDSGGTAVVVDLSAVGFMDSSGVHALLEARKVMLANGGSLVVEGKSAPVARVLDLLGLSDLLARPDDA